MMGRGEGRKGNGTRRRRRSDVLAVALAILMISISGRWVGAAEVRAVFDLKGQIIGIVDADGSVATYSWDESQNLVGITRTDAGSIRGPIGITLAPNGRPAIK